MAAQGVKPIEEVTVGRRTIGIEPEPEGELAVADIGMLPTPLNPFDPIREVLIGRPLMNSVLNGLLHRRCRSCTPAESELAGPC